MRHREVGIGRRQGQMAGGVLSSKSRSMNGSGVDLRLEAKTGAKSIMEPPRPRRLEKYTNVQALYVCVSQALRCNLTKVQPLTRVLAGPPPSLVPGLFSFVLSCLVLSSLVLSSCLLPCFQSVLANCASRPKTTTSGQPQPLESTSFSAQDRRFLAALGRLGA